MGAIGERAIQVKIDKAREDTNQRLDRLIAAQERTNQLLEALFPLLAPRPQQPDPRAQTSRQW